MRRASMPNEESRSPPECFICTESDPRPRKSACKCTDRHVHDACLVRMLETGTHDRCPVCLELYSNLLCQYELVSWTACSRGGIACVYLIFAILLLACSAEMWWALVKPYPLSTRALRLVFVALVLFLSFAAVTAVAFLHECLTVGVANLARSMLVYRRRVNMLTELHTRSAPTD